MYLNLITTSQLTGNGCWFLGSPFELWKLHSFILCWWCSLKFFEEKNQINLKCKMLLLINLKWPLFVCKASSACWGRWSLWGALGSVLGTNHVSVIFFFLILFLELFFCWVEVGKQLVELLLVLPWVCLERKSTFQWNVRGMLAVQEK